MLLNNYFNYLIWLNNANFIAGNASPRYLDVPGVYFTNSDTCQVDYCAYNTEKTIRHKFPYQDLRLYIGKSDAAPNASQFNLIHQVNLTNAQWDTIFSVDSSTQKLKIKLLYSGTNTTDSPITIKEYMIVKRVGREANGNIWPNREIAFIRGLLDSPITIQPNESAVIAVDWDIQ